MARTLLLSSPAFSWREWLKEHRGERDLLNLDPSDPAQGPPGRLTLVRGSKPVYTRFYGSLEPARAPHVLIAALAHMIRESTEGAVLQLFAIHHTPLLKQTVALCAQLFQADEILAPKGADLDLEGLPIGPEEVQSEAAFPAMVQQAQRKAQWLKLLESCSSHEVDLKRTTIDGARLGSGRPLLPDQLAKVGLKDVLHAEIGGETLVLISDAEPEENKLTRALDVFHATRAAVVSPDAYQNLLCSFARENGEDFGVGIVKSIDFAKGIAHIACTAVPPAPVRILRLGGMRVDASGRELGEVRPWSL